MKLRIALFVNPKKSKALEVKEKIKDMLGGEGIEIVPVKKADIAVTIGGDGTLLYFFQKVRADIPVFGIGSERSFICQITMKDWRLLKGLLRKGFGIENRMVLACYKGNRMIGEALNDIVFSSRRHKAVGIEIEVDRKYRFLADGVIFATPTGSSAYAYSCGGKELPKSSERYEIVAIAPYRRSFKPLLVSGKKRAYVRVFKGEADLILDGQKSLRVKDGRYRIERSKRKFRLIQINK